MSRLLCSFVVCLAVFGGAGLAVTGCRSTPRKLKTSSAEDGPKLTQPMVDQLVQGETTLEQVEQIVGATPNETKLEDDGRLLWVFAWSRATADEEGTLLELQLRVLKVFFRDGVVDEKDYAESTQ